MFVSRWKWKTKQWSPLPSLLSCESLVFVEKNTNKKRRKEENKTEKNTDTGKTDIKAPPVRYNAKIIPQ